MKIYKSIIAALAVSLTVASCSDEFLNDPAPTNSVPPELIYDSFEGAHAYMSGILRLMRGQYLDTQTGNLGSMYFARTVKGNDVLISSNWFLNDYAHLFKDANQSRTDFTWKFSYDIIKHVNTLIQGVNASSTITQEDKDYLVSQALGIRAFYYFELSLEYQQTYVFNPDLDAPPIYDEPTLVGKPMSTQRELYAFIESDLLKAIEIGSEDRTDKSYFNTNVYHAVLARVYQVMGNWAGAEEHANLAYGGATVAAVLDPASYDDGFSNLNNREWIWGTPQSDDQSAYYWTAPHPFFEHYVTAYANAFINIGFTNKFSGTDVRNVFENPYELPDTDFRSRVTTKFAFSFNSATPILRTAEMILIEAEAKMHNGDENGGHDLLYALQVNRDPNAVKSSNTGATLYDELYLERRKELYGEMGVEWYDAKRLRRGINRDPIHQSPVNLTPDDKRFILKIPISEIDSNPLIDETVNANR